MKNKKVWGFTKIHEEKRNKRYKKIIHLYFRLIDKEKKYPTHVEIANELNISRERVRQLFNHMVELGLLIKYKDNRHIVHYTEQ